MSRKVQVDQRKVGDSNLQCFSSSFIFLLLKKSGSFNSVRRKYVLWPTDRSALVR